MNAAKLHETALHHAAKVKHLGLIDLLVEFGGNVYATDNLGKKPIYYAGTGSPAYLCLEFFESKLSIHLDRYHTQRCHLHLHLELLAEAFIQSDFQRFIYTHSHSDGGVSHAR